MRGKRTTRSSGRTCVGCGEIAPASELVRVVRDGATGVLVDWTERLESQPGGVSKTLVGRGAWLHARTRCLEGAAKHGLKRSFREPIAVGHATLTVSLRRAADARVRALIRHAGRAGKLRPLVARGAPGEASALLLRARDAAFAEGPSGARALTTFVWGTREELGRAVATAKADLLAVVDPRVARALSRALEMVYLAGPSVDGSPREAYSEAG